jgi:hypothetical protein
MSFFRALVFGTRHIMDIKLHVLKQLNKGDVMTTKTKEMEKKAAVVKKVAAKVKAEGKKAKGKKELSDIQNKIISLLKISKGAKISGIQKETGLEYRKVYIQILNWMKFGHPVKKVDKATFQYISK